MKIYQAIILGAVQGFTEFLPVSSSGHLMLLQQWFGLQEGALFTSVMLHIGTLIPVIVVLWKEIIGLFKNKWSRLWLLALSSVPAGLVGLLFESVLDLDLLFSEHLWLLGITFLLTAGELYFAEIYSKRNVLDKPITVKTAFIMGCGQAVGVLPGLSRSGATITFGTLAKVEKKENGAWAFLMSIPIIVAAVFLQLYKGVKNGFGSVEVLPLVFGVVTAMITGYIAIKFMLVVIKKANYKWFSLYLVLMSIATFITAFN